MSAEDEDKAQGEILLNFSKVKRRLAVLQEEARTVGQQLSSLGNALEHSPELISFDGQAMGLHYATKRQDYKAATVDAKRISMLVEDIRKTLDERNHLEEKIKELGLD